MGALFPTPGIPWILGTTYVPYTVVTSPVVSAPIRAYRGWPMDTQLQTDLKAGTTNISIFSAPALARDTTRFLRMMTEQTASQAPVTMTATMTNNIVTFAGTGSASEVIGIADIHHGYAYRLSDMDTPTTVAAVFAANIPSATSSGPTLTINTSNVVSVAYSADITTLTEVHRQLQIVRVSVWTPTTTLRDQICSILDPAIMWYDRIVFAENSISGPIRNAGTHVDDIVGVEFMWRRDLLYHIEYPTMYKRIETPMVLGEITPLEQYI
jgi:hypothetical protein